MFRGTISKRVRAEEVAVILANAVFLLSIILMEEDSPIPLMEGIDIHYDTRQVSFSNEHEDNVDTSLENNPTESPLGIPDVPVWSIFRRKGGAFLDGNPLAYALKNEYGWTFATPKDKENILNQFNLIAEKFLETHSFDVTLVLPSTNPLNDFIAETVVSKASNIGVIEGFVRKLTTEEVAQAVLEPNSTFKQVFNTPPKFESALNDLKRYLRVMDETKNGIFIRHLVRNPEIRNAIDTTMKLSEDVSAEDANKINGTDVLIIDDVISRGQSIREVASIIKASYAPKSITALTLISPL